MKVRVVLTVEVDPEVWAAEYGLGSVAEVREDVKAYLLTAATEVETVLAVEGGN